MSGIHGQQGFHFAVQNENHRLSFSSSFLEVSKHQNFRNGSLKLGCHIQAGTSLWVSYKKAQCPLFTLLLFLSESRGVCGAEIS